MNDKTKKAEDGLDFKLYSKHLPKTFKLLDDASLKLKLDPKIEAELKKLNRVTLNELLAAGKKAAQKQNGSVPPNFFKTFVPKKMQQHQKKANALVKKMPHPPGDKPKEKLKLKIIDGPFKLFLQGEKKQKLDITNTKKPVKTDYRGTLNFEVKHDWFGGGK